MNEQKFNSIARLGFLLSQIGVYASSEFARRMKPLGLSPSHAGIMRLLLQKEGQSQKELAQQLSLLPSRLVLLIDEMETKGLVERRADPEDRRTYALFVTEAGKDIGRDIQREAGAHADAMSHGLTPEEKMQLVGLLTKIAENQGLKANVHPGYRLMKEKDGD